MLLLQYAVQLFRISLLARTTIDVLAIFSMCVFASIGSCAIACSTLGNAFLPHSIIIKVSLAPTGATYMVLTGVQISLVYKTYVGLAVLLLVYTVHYYVVKL